ncbi:integral membrane protein [Fusarium denticulatum]|uniref:Integral membrane protein n=1 Tax=Fusarium denticulatum TaxID=48507 RepID=A0A8H5XJL0_9HYPO|nr:integral membrane protein [Fusarium denticulatum]
MPRAHDHFHGRHYRAERTTGPVKALNPTNRYLVADKKTPNAESDTGKESRPTTESPGVAYVWRSRDNRKGRHALAISVDPHKHEATKGPRPSNSYHQTLCGILKMFVRYPVWDVSYDVAVVFTIGSIIWVINGFYSFLPVLNPSTKVSDWAGGLTAFIGATVFEFGSFLLMLEAVNENRSDCFGWAVEESVDGMLHLTHAHDCKHAHAQKGTFVKQSSRSLVNNAADSSGKDRMWSWWPTWYELRTHYFFDIGFLACSSQTFGATIFWISGFTALPPILNGLSTPAENGVYWLPQVIGGTGFIVSSILFMVEVQPRWYIPAPGVLGWHIGLWNLIGAIGFTLCGALGFGITHPGVEYALTLSTFIGSWAFLIGSVIQCSTRLYGEVGQAKGDKRLFFPDANDFVVGFKAGWVAGEPISKFSLLFQPCKKAPQECLSRVKPREYLNESGNPVPFSDPKISDHLWRNDLPPKELQILPPCNGVINCDITKGGRLMESLVFGITDEDLSKVTAVGVDAQFRGTSPSMVPAEKGFFTSTREYPSIHLEYNS